MAKISLISIGANDNAALSRVITQVCDFEPNLIIENPWSPAITNNGYLKNNNFLYSGILCFDVDNKPGQTFLSLENAVKLISEYKHVIATTRSHQKPKDGNPPVDKYRVILFYESDIMSADQYSYNYKLYANTILPLGVADATSDAARFFYSCKEIISVSETGLLVKVLEKPMEAISSVSKALPISGSERKLTKKTLEFLSGITPIAEWHNQSRDAIFDFKAKGYDIDKCRELVSKAGTQTWDDNDEKRLKDIYFNRTPYDNTDATEPFRQFIRSCTLIEDVNDPGTIFAASNKTNKITPIATSILTKSFNEEERAENFLRTIRAKPVYEPFSRGLISTDENGAPTYNLYQPPTWQLEYFYKGGSLPEPIPTLPSLVERFFKHLTENDESSYNYILDWLHYAITARNFTVLTMIGSEGIGKGIFTTLASNMVGKSNFGKARANIFKGRFNSILAHKRLVLLDELELKTTEEYNLFKDLVNAQIIIEKKGVDESLENNHASFILASNNRAGVKPPSDDRRFSLIYLTTTKLGANFTDEEITSLETDEELAIQTVRYLLGHTAKHKNTTPFKDLRKQVEIEEAGQADYESYLLNEFASEHIGKSFPVMVLKNMLKDDLGMRNGPGRTKLEQFCLKHKNYFKFYQSNNGRYIKILSAPKIDESIYKVLDKDEQIITTGH
jgi:hypothetical protein